MLAATAALDTHAAEMAIDNFVFTVVPLNVVNCLKLSRASAIFIFNESPNLNVTFCVNLVLRGTFVINYSQ